MSNNQSHITIRQANGSDTRALARLAELDSAAIPQQPLLVALADGELQAAMSMTDGAAVADPFAHSAEMVAMLRIEAGMSTQPANGLRAYRRLWPRPPKPAAARPSAPSIPGFPVIPGNTL